MPPKMNQDFLTKLPSEIITNILSRLPIPTILLSKCVCKPWLHLLETDEFTNFHLAKSVPCLVILTPKSETDSSSCESDSRRSCAIFEFEDEQDLDHHDLHYNQLTKFDFPHTTEIKGSANGLLFLSNLNDKPEAHYVCNPITRNYVEVRCPKELIRPYQWPSQAPEESGFAYPQSVTYGFGLSKITGEYKVVRIYHDSVITRKFHGRTERTIPESECHVHTLGTESWRRVAPCALLEYSARTSRVFLNGCLHWIVYDSNSNLWISCFDLETECFSTFSTPPVNLKLMGDLGALGGLSALDDCLCFCDHTREDEIVIWLMKEYGVEKSWSKEYVININDDLYIEGWEPVYPIKVFKDGDILMLREDCQLFHYANKTQTAQEIGFFTADMIKSILLTPSFVSLKSLGMENVISL